MKIRKKLIRSQQLRSRRGFSMIEMLVAVSLASLLLSINAVWIYHTMRFSSRVSQRHQQHQNLTRLAGEFRDDVRSCEKIEVVNKNEIKLTASAGNAATWTANYKITGTDIFLSRQTGSQTNMERFSLSPSSVIRWDVSEMPETISLLISRDPNKFPERKSKADQKVDSTNSLPVQETAAEDLVPLMHLRVSRNRWSGKSPPNKPDNEAELKKESEPETENKTELSKPTSNVETIEEPASATN